MNFEQIIQRTKEYEAGAYHGLSFEEIDEYLTELLMENNLMSQYDEAIKIMKNLYFA